MIDLRGGDIPDSFDAYASGVSGFTQSAIDRACRHLETSMDQMDKRTPELPFLIAACRNAAFELKPKLFCGNCDEGFVFENAQGQPWNWRTGEKRYARTCPNCRPNRILEHPKGSPIV